MVCNKMTTIYHYKTVTFCNLSHYSVLYKDLVLWLDLTCNRAVGRFCQVSHELIAELWHGLWNNLEVIGTGKQIFNIFQLNGSVFGSVW